MRSPILYIDTPTIPPGMTVETYRKVRALERAKRTPRGIRRVDSPAVGGQWR
jgi:hypothetical protein